MSKNVMITESQREFILALSAKFGADAVLTPKEILEFAEKNKFKRPNWFFGKNGVGVRKSYARWGIPENMIVKPAKQPKVVKTKVVKTKAKKSKVVAPVPEFTDNVVVDDRDREVKQAA